MAEWKICSAKAFTSTAASLYLMLKLLYGRCYATLFFLNKLQAQNWTRSMKMEGCAVNTGSSLCN
jgi:hypothetical protein